MNPIEENEVETDDVREMDTTEVREAEVRQVLKKTEWKDTWKRWDPSRIVQGRQ